MSRNYELISCLGTCLLPLQLLPISEDSILVNLILSYPSRMVNLLAFRSLKTKKYIGKVLVKTFLNLFSLTSTSVTYT